MIVGLADAPDVVAVVPTLGGATERLRRCLTAVLASDTRARLAVVVVWNDPRRPVPDLPGPVTVLEPGVNLGFPGGLAQARSAAAPAARALWLVQDDVTPATDCLDALLARLDAADRPGVVAPVAIDERGLVPARSRGGVLDAAGGMDHWFPLEDVAPEQVDLGHRLDYVASSGSLVDLAAWDTVGGYDPGYWPLLWSDVDFCFRVGRAGRAAVLEPAARVEHVGNASTPGLLALHLGQANAARFARVFAGEPVAPPPVTADPALVATVARAAGTTAVDVAGLGTRLLRERDERLATLTAAYDAATAERRALVAQSDVLLAERDAARAERDALAAEVGRLGAELGAMRATVSWRVTAPLRAVQAWRRRLRPAS